MTTGYAGSDLSRTKVGLWEAQCPACADASLRASAGLLGDPLRVGKAAAPFVDPLKDEWS